MEKYIVVNELFYGWKAGTTEIDENGNSGIDVKCYSYESLVNEIDFLIDTEKNKKRGYLKQLHFITKSVEYLVRETGNRKYEVFTMYTNKPVMPMNIVENKDIKTALNHVKQVLKIFYKK